MGLLDRLTDRALALLGLDFALDLTEVPFHRITGHLHLGGRPTEATVPALREAGITHVVSCLPERLRGEVAFLEHSEAPLQTTFYDLRDGIHADPSLHFPSFFATMEQTRACGGQLLVHCQLGVSRSATFATAWVMRSQQLRFFEAVQLVRARRPQVLPNIGFASQLQQLEHELVGARTDGEPSSLARYLHEICQVPIERGVLDEALEQHGHDALASLTAIFGDELPRVIQGVRR